MVTRALALTKRDAVLPVWSNRFVLISFVTFLHQGRKVRTKLFRRILLLFLLIDKGCLNSAKRF
jgi:hypothetical protein